MPFKYATNSATTWAQVSTRPAEGASRLPLSVHSCGGVALVEETRRGQPDHYLSLFHVKSSDVDDTYTTFAYRFAAEPPFSIIEISGCPLPLDRHSFASSLTVGRCRLNQVDP